MTQLPCKPAKRSLKSESREQIPLDFFPLRFKRKKERSLTISTDYYKSHNSVEYCDHKYPFKPLDSCVYMQEKTMSLGPSFDLLVMCLELKI